MSAKYGEEFLLVEERVDEIGIQVERVGQTRIDDFQYHAHHFVDYGQIVHLYTYTYIYGEK